MEDVSLGCLRDGPGFKKVQCRDEICLHFTIHHGLVSM